MSRNAFYCDELRGGGVASVRDNSCRKTAARLLLRSCNTITQKSWFCLRNNQSFFEHPVSCFEYGAFPSTVEGRLGIAAARKEASSTNRAHQYVCYFYARLPYMGGFSLLRELEQNGGKSGALLPRRRCPSQCSLRTKPSDR